jgi:hypothetical protein
MELEKMLSEVTRLRKTKVACLLLHVDDRSKCVSNVFQMCNGGAEEEKDNRVIKLKYILSV